LCVVFSWSDFYVQILTVFRTHLSQPAAVRYVYTYVKANIDLSAVIDVVFVCTADIDVWIYTHGYNHRCIYILFFPLARDYIYYVF
jgi:hypothetical protein